MSIKISLNMTIKGVEMKENVINLKDIRLKSGLTQDEVAKKLGVSLRTYQRYENDSNNLGLNKILEISKQLGVSMDILMGNGVKVVGDDNIAFSGDGNFVSEPKNSKLQSKIFKEFMELYTEYGNDKILMPAIEKLKEIKQISEK